MLGQHQLRALSEQDQDSPLQKAPDRGKTANWQGSHGRSERSEKSTVK